MRFVEPTKPHRKSGMWGTRRSWSGQGVRGGIAVTSELDTSSANCRSLGFTPNDPKKRIECCGIPLKPKPGLNGAPSLRCR
jgi:hypothetical protein